MTLIDRFDSEPASRRVLFFMQPDQASALIQAIAICRELKDYRASGELIRLFDDHGYEVLDKGDRIELYKPMPTVEPTIDDLIARRQAAREGRDWAEADRLRSLIQDRTGKRLVDRGDGGTALI